MNWLARTAALAALAAAFVATCADAHGIVLQVVYDGYGHPGYDPKEANLNPPGVVGWKVEAGMNGSPVVNDAFAKPDIVCGKDATPAQNSITVKAGTKITVQRSKWPDTHHGVVMDYLASCNGPCAKAEATSLKFVKLDEKGMIEASKVPGKAGLWATDEMLAAGSAWTITLPKGIKDGEYVLRHEIIALHGAEKDNFTEAYPQCINLIVTGGDPSAPAELPGIPATAFYTDIPKTTNIYADLKSYTLPGPPVWSGTGGPATPGGGIPGAGDGTDYGLSSGSATVTRNRATVMPGVTGSPSAASAATAAVSTSAPASASESAPASVSASATTRSLAVAASTTAAPMPDGTAAAGASSTSMPTATGTESDAAPPAPSSTSAAAAGTGSASGTVPPAPSTTSAPGAGSGSGNITRRCKRWRKKGY